MEKVCNLKDFNAKEFFEETDCYIFLLAKVYQKAHRIMQKRLKKYGLTNIQHLVLETLWLFPGITGVEMSKVLNIDKATLSGVVERLNRDGWLDKKEDESDKRVIRLYPTEKSLKLRDTLISLRKEANGELLKNFGLEEKVLFKKFLLELLEY